MGPSRSHAGWCRITPEVGGADNIEEEWNECSEALEVYPLWGRDLPCGRHCCCEKLELLPLKASVAVCRKDAFGGPFCHTFRLV